MRRVGAVVPAAVERAVRGQLETRHQGCDNRAITGATHSGETGPSGLRICGVLGTCATPN